MPITVKDAGQAQAERDVKVRTVYAPTTLGMIDSIGLSECITGYESHERASAVKTEGCARENRTSKRNLERDKMIVGLASQWDGWATDEIADELGVSLGVVQRVLRDNHRRYWLKHYGRYPTRRRTDGWSEPWCD